MHELKKQKKTKDEIKDNVKRKWNVRSLSRCGKLEDLNRELENYKWDVIGLAETRCKGTGEKITVNCHTFLYSG